MPSRFGVGKGGGERQPARLGQDLLGEMRHRCAQDGGMPPLEYGGNRRPRWCSAAMGWLAAAW